MNVRAAFTYLELLVVVVIMAIISLVALSTGNAATTEQGRLAGELFAADVAYARSLAIARPDDPVVIKVDTTANKYWLARAAAPDTPIAHPATYQPYVVSFGPTGNAGLARVQILACSLGGDNILGFNSLGTTDQQTPAVLQVTSAGQAYEVDVQSNGAKTTVTRGLLTELQAVATPTDELGGSEQPTDTQTQSGTHISPGVAPAVGGEVQGVAGP